MVPARSATAADRTLSELFAREWERALAENPTMASELGDRRYDDRWPDVSLAAKERSREADRSVLAELAKLEAGEFSAEARLSAALFRRKYETRIEEYDRRAVLIPLTSREGIQDASSFADGLPFADEEAFAAWLGRLRSFDVYADQTIELLRAGVHERIVHARTTTDRVREQVDRQIVDDPAESPFFKPFHREAPFAPNAAWQALRLDAEEAIRSVVVPAYRRLADFLRREYAPASFEAPGVWQMPHGEEYYSFLARKFTTTSLAPREIHELGLAEVARLRRAMDETVRETGFRGSFQEFLADLRTNRRFYFDDAAELMAEYRRICDRVDEQLPKLFARLPRVWYDVQPIPDQMAPDTTTAYYRPLSADGSRQGTYFVNLYRPEVRPKYEMEALSLHEAVPGHHLQIALAMELADLPAFRRYAAEGEYTGYVEGWALYAESLGNELGCYRDPYSRFGQLTYEAWRAVRLVVDPGIHAFGWTRAAAIDYFAENTGKALHDIENEVDRYISWPGQALAYKVGELHVTRLRRKAEAALGWRFDVKEFHDVLLRQGAVPLDVLEALVDQWLAAAAGDASGDA